MDATTVATAGVQPGDTATIRMAADRLSKLQRLRLIDQLIGVLEASLRAEASLGASIDMRSLQVHRAQRDRLASELGL